MTDLPRYKTALAQTQRLSWHHYFVFLYFFGQRPDIRFLLEQDQGSLCVYRLRQNRSGQDLSLFMLPMPWKAQVLQRALARLWAFAPDGKASVYRVDEADLAPFRGRADVRIVTCDAEYIYAPAQYADLSGNRMRNLRRAVRAIDAREDVRLVDYQPQTHEAACWQVYQRWAQHQQSRYEAILHQALVRGCLSQYELFGREDLLGQVAIVGDTVRAFGFAGAMHPGAGNQFLVYSDHTLPDLAKYMNYRLFLKFAHLPWVNSGNAGPTQGLALAKQALVPVALKPVYQLYFRPPR